MKNLKNNKIYNLARLFMLATSVLSTIIILLRLLLPQIARKFFFVSSYMSWMLIDAGYTEYQSSHLSATLVKLISACTVSVLIYLICWLASKKSVYFMVGALAYYIFDSYMYVYDAYYFYSNKYLIVGTIFKSVFALAMIIGIYYGIIGRKIERYVDDEEIAPDIRFTNSDYSQELSLQQRTITFKRNKEFFNSYIYIQIVVDDRNRGYVKDGEEQEFILDGNSHVIKIISHFASIKSRGINLPRGDENKSYMILFKHKFLFFKQIVFQETTK